MRVEINDHMGLCTDTYVAQLLPLVSPERRQQALRYTHTFGRFCCLMSWLMLEKMIGPMDPWQYNEYGKPYLPNGPHFSISHCKKGIAVVTDNHPIGIDIESIRHADPELIERTMSPAEQQQILLSPDPDRTFTRLWTCKEALVKAQGIGLVSFDQIRKVLTDPQWKLQTTETEQYIVTIAFK